MATHSSILAWEIPWTEEPGQAAVYGVAKSHTGLGDSTTFILQHTRRQLYMCMCLCIYVCVCVCVCVLSPV